MKQVIKDFINGLLPMGGVLGIVVVVMIAIWLFIEFTGLALWTFLVMLLLGMTWLLGYARRKEEEE